MSLSGSLIPVGGHLTHRYTDLSQLHELVTMRLSPLSLVRGWRAAALLVVVACASPQRAAAECGDYAIILNAPAESAHPGPSAPGETHTPAPAPCRGSNCEGAPDRHVPPLAPVTPAGPQANEPAFGLEPTGGADREPRSFDRDHTSPRPVRRAASVFHPPRLG
jgi:hypothetical protein